MEITLEEAFAGKTAQVRIPTSVTASLLRERRQTGSKPKTADLSGREGAHRRALHAGAHVRRLSGRGQVIDNPCPNCSGSGRVTRERTLSVNVPAGVEDGTRIRLAGEGEAGVRGGPAATSTFSFALDAPVLPADGAICTAACRSRW